MRLLALTTGITRVFWFGLLLAVLAACGGESTDIGTPGGEGDEATLRTQLVERGLDGDPANGLAPVRPGQDPLVKLGQVLFFSRALSGRLDVACASCHHPDFAGGDGLSLPIGVAASEPHVLGLGRTIDPEKDLAPDADGGPNVPRNSQTVFNSALYNRALFHDGRVFVLDEETVPGGAGQAIRTPESGNVAADKAGQNLLEVQARFPLVSNDEMRGFIYSSLSNPSEYRNRLVRRLRGEVDQNYMGTDASDAANWESLFTDAFSSTAEDGKMITMLRIQEALAAYQRSLIFVDTPWKEYMEGDEDALSAAALRGAKLFFGDKDNGGLGCAGCHSGDHFTNEEFYNAGFPQIGRGKRTNDSDHGRADVNVTLQTDKNQYAFRVPSLINVELTAPYGHAGTFASLEQVIHYHANPTDEIDSFNFDLQHLPQAQLSDGSGLELYPNAESLTRAAIQADSFQDAEQKLPARTLTADEVDDVVAFLKALTDDCAATPSCVADWVPDGDTDDPDGLLLVRDEPFDEPSGGATEPEETYASHIDLAFPELPALSTFEDTDGCTTEPSAVPNTGENRFIRKDSALGLDAVHGFSESTWLANADGGSFALDETMQAGGISAGYLSGSCWPDLVFSGGDAPEADGVILYENEGEQEGFVARPDRFVNTPSGPFTSVSIADLNGDYRRELLFANLHQVDLPIYALDSSQRYKEVGTLPMGRSTFGIGFADVDGNGYPDMYMAHWSASGLPGTAPAFWDNEDGTRLVPSDEAAGTSEEKITQNRNFAPGFADFDGDGEVDLAVASDFNTSVVLQNDGAGSFIDVTDREVITDSNGMGAAIADFDNDGRLDWFVDSVKLSDEYDWDGNRLYWNRSTESELKFINNESQDGVEDGGWAWGACAADINNDGWQDIFHVNGYGKVPASLAGGAMDPYIEGYQPFADAFGDKPPRLFINNRDGTFSERAADWALDVPSEGRGVVCFDYDRDGDIDIGVLDHSSGIQFFENQVGNSAGKRFLSLRLVGKRPNTEALGALVKVKADLDGDGEIGDGETQLRSVSANSNFASQNPPDLHFGLGEAQQVDSLEVVWPDGESFSCSGVEVNRFLVVDQKDEHQPDFCS